VESVLTPQAQLRVYKYDTEDCESEDSGAGSKGNSSDKKGGSSSKSAGSKKQHFLSKKKEKKARSERNK
jgi:hypothetical protein